MCSVIREVCLDEDNKLNANVGRIQELLDAAFPNETVRFVPLRYSVVVGPTRKVYDVVEGTCPEGEKYRKATWDAINEVELREERERVERLTKDPDAVRAEQEVALREEREMMERLTKERNESRAAQEAKALGLTEAYEIHPRPEGAAPVGKTWAYTIGEWKDEKWLTT